MNNINLYKKLGLVLEMNNVEKRKDAVFKHGTIPDINIMRKGYEFNFRVRIETFIFHS